MTSEAEAFSLTVKAYSADLYRYAYWLCKQPHQSEDLVQETFLRAWKKRKGLNNEKAIKFWLFTILRHEFLRTLNRSERLKFEPIDEKELNQLPDTQFNPEDSLALRQLLHQIPENLREPLVLQVLGGFSSQDIAELLSINEGTVYTRLTRARQWFRRSVKAKQERAL